MGINEILESYFEKINEFFEELRDIIKKMKHTNNLDERKVISEKSKEVCDNIDKNIDKAKRGLGKLTDKEKFENILCATNQTYEFLKSEIDKLLTNKEVDNKRKNNINEDRYNDKEIEKQHERVQLQEHAKGRTDEILGIWSEINGITEGIQIMNQDTIDIANKTKEKLKIQTEKMEKIQADLDDLGDGIKRAGRELGGVFRNFYRDYIIVGCFGTILIVTFCLIVIRIIMYVTGKSGVSQSGSNSPG